jgi:dual specificity phosphatase 9
MIRQSNATPILKNLWLGNAIIAKNNNFLVNNNIKYIINVSTNVPNYFSDLTYLNISVNDKFIKPQDTINIFNNTGKFIYNALKNNEGILVHCKKGDNKSASIIASFLIKYIKLNLIDAVRYLIAIKPNCLSRITNFTKGLTLYSKNFEKNT